MRYGALDRFRVVAAVLVVAIHTSPLLVLGEGANQFFSHVLARVAVPFFFMVTGFFLQKGGGTGLGRSVGRGLVLYLAAILLYLPLGVRAGYYGPEGQGILRELVFGGTFYHLWYLPASVLGTLIVFGPLRRLPPVAALAVCGALYAVGLMGDSYYGLVSGTVLEPVVRLALVLGQTRNGIFFAPLFLCLGGRMAECPAGKSGRKTGLGLAVSLLLLAAEGMAFGRVFPEGRHDSMYVMLAPAMCFLFRWLLSFDAAGSRTLRRVSTGVYILHPWVIVLVRGAAGVTGLTGPLVENTLVHFAAVSLLSLGISLVPALALARKSTLSGGAGQREVN